ncbi:lysostaphin resistance A-like protein [Vibrio amylolyticus]|uniref:CPBP family intramembrane glutamic endopeptidase n=1 Tax=Vibrio TaxID=662 RepID=UPI000C822417|nr:CPBP family intramembrane glutamic endopeptidase [Vibrio sp. 10N.261.55.A7]PMJ90625.1 hypothetical protein BCU12_11645 [Vibrio sp. 10N.261.55.A7]
MTCVSSSNSKLSLNAVFTQLCTFYLLAIAVQVIGRFLVSRVSENEIIIDIGENTAALLLVVRGLSYFGLWGEIGWFTTAKWKSFPVFLVPALYIVLNFNGAYGHDLSTVLQAALNTVISASFEELLCRLMALHLLIHGFTAQGNKRPILCAVLTSSLLFGFAHFTNLLNQPEALGAIIGQMIYASFIGIGFAACYIVTRSIVPLIVIHASINFVSFWGESKIEPPTLTFEDTLGTVIVCFPLLLLGLWLLRHEPK